MLLRLGGITREFFIEFVTTIIPMVLVTEFVVEATTAIALIKLVDFVFKASLLLNFGLLWSL